ncbi:hypothetical protein SAMN05216266_13526 [Amycolatopsis marina]|uniref:DUF4350 domain-containing protein n=2 Tax=Amycolatopsis marina TaxID=490629 RepID=A0A1I1CN47_9PSEU|nr:hypothetical protein SAMN05216266_13526 [Amycolatopsis marina]
MAVILALPLLALGAAPVATAQEIALPPKLDVEAALDALRTQQIHRVPGAVAHFDEDLIRDEMTGNMRVLVAPPRGPTDGNGHYKDIDQYFQEVERKLDAWTKETGLRLISVIGLDVSYRYLPPSPLGGPGEFQRRNMVPDTLAEARQHVAQHDVTATVWRSVRQVKDTTDDPMLLDHPVAELTEASPARTAELADLLRENPVHNAPGRTEEIRLSVAEIRQETGFDVRVAAFPVADPADPLVDHAPALAEHFPGEVIVVAYGAWLEVAGPHQAQLTSSRDSTLGRSEGRMHALLPTVNSNIVKMLRNADRLITDRPFSRPQTPPLREIIITGAPWLFLGSALILGGGGLAHTISRKTLNARARRGALRETSAEAFAAITQLGRRLLAADPATAPVMVKAAERHSTATALFDRSTTPAAMAEVRSIAEQGSRLLDEHPRDDRHEQ